jgi:hypothetical protein
MPVVGGLQSENCDSYGNVILSRSAAEAKNLEKLLGCFDHYLKILRFAQNDTGKSWTADN